MTDAGKITEEKIEGNFNEFDYGHMSSSSGETRIFINHIKEESEANVTAFDDFLQDEKYELLYRELKKKGVATLDELKAINLWSFMNLHQLYSIQQRLEISIELTTKLRNMEKEEYEAYIYEIHYNYAVYKGVSPSEAFVAFLTPTAAKYPLKFRGLLDIAHPKTGKVVVSRHSGDAKLRMMNPDAYIDSNLTLEQVKLYIAWIMERCGVAPREYEIKECKKITENSGKTMPIIDSKESESQSNKTCKSKDCETSDLYFTGKAEDYLLQCDLSGATYKELQNELHCTMVKTKEIVAQSQRIIEMNKRLYHESSLVDFEEGADKIEAILDKLLKKNNGITTAKHLYEYALSEMAMFFNDNDIKDQQSVFDLARHLFEKMEYHGKHYFFHSNMYISFPEISANSNFSIIKKYAREKGSTVTAQELEDYLAGLGLNTSGLRTMMKIDKEPIFFVYAENEYLLAELMHIEDLFLKTIHSALQHLLEDIGGYIIPRNISDSWYKLLPTLPDSLVWTPMLLQQLIRFYPDELQARTIIAMDSQNSNTLHAMFVEKDSWIQDFRDVVAVFLHNEMPNRCEFEAEELRGILVDAGMISGNQLIYNMPNALGGDPRFIWNSEGSYVKVRI